MKIEKNFNRPIKPFNAQMLKTGEMMEVNDADYENYAGEILFKSDNGFYSLSGKSWHDGCYLKGRKLLPGESVTLTQE